MGNFKPKQNTHATTHQNPKETHTTHKKPPPPNSHKTNHDRTETTKHDQPLHPKNMHHNAPFYTPHRPTEQTRT